MLTCDQILLLHSPLVGTWLGFQEFDFDKGNVSDVTVEILYVNLLDVQNLGSKSFQRKKTIAWSDFIT